MWIAMAIAFAIGTQLRLGLSLVYWTAAAAHFNWTTSADCVGLWPLASDVTSINNQEIALGPVRCLELISPAI